MSSFMSFLTLGLTADAAAAHRHEFSSATSTITSTYNGRFVGSRAPSRTPSGTIPLQSLTSIISHSSSTLDAASQASQAASERESTPKPRQSRTKTTYHLAAPPPSNHINRIHSVVRPGRSLILQLQRLSAFTRPLPSYDVIPALAFATKPKRKRPINFRTLGLHDLVILSSEEYTDQNDDDENEDEDLSHRIFVASISPITRKDREDDSVKALIEFPGGVVWEASQKPNGSYEFMCRQENGETSVARWILRVPNSRRKSSQTMTPGRETRSAVQGEKKFQFSMINASTRRHPILATMAGQRIDINDQYSASTNVCSRPGSPSGFSRFDAMSTHSLSDYEAEKVLIQTEEHIKTLIVVTGTWVTLREGFNGRSWFDESLLASTPLRPPMTPKTPITPVENSAKGEKRGLDWPAQKVIRRGTSLGHQATTGVVKPLEEESTSASARRTNSTGSTFKRSAFSKLGSPCNSPASTRAPSPETTIRFVTVPGNPDPILPAQLTTSLSSPLPSSPVLPQLQQSNRLSVPDVQAVNRSPSKSCKQKPDKDRWRRKSMPPRSGDGAERKGGQKKTLRQKISRVFSILRRNPGDS
ncbi:hypothetical protein L211DRAFT_281960 [Terfezia boudieri ATCC MYA-4762]|uniref:Uncharacterized protein n=1 Tax=Terfezia boudieri ATCC MYA-4762 TaxID=1051890 RepID=A0A3N4LPQ9_9PEZI|nr:hypothetical protein L211DRAFT_281960 [Terfezia boudieri ATCC MYA-4762]